MTTTVSINATMGVSLQCQKQVTNTADPTATPANIGLDLSSINPGAFRASWNSGTTPDGEDAWSGQIALSSGAATIDLTNLTQTNLSTVINATGKKIRVIALLADANNANVIAIGTGASNGYAGIGTISALLAGNMTIRTCNGSTAIDGTHKTLDLAGTGSQILNILIIFGS